MIFLLKNREIETPHLFYQTRDILLSSANLIIMLFKCLKTYVLDQRKYYYVVVVNDD